jgi:preprotein translocase subunit SecD
VLLDETAVQSVGPMRVGEKHDRPAIAMEMTPDGARRLGEITAANIGRRLALVLDGKVLIAPTINARITDAVIIELSQNPPGADDDVLGRLHAAVYALPE